ncbi:beta-galactosidase [Candidatus Uhrbacteria bacterium]|nr:beta-galactosidase [Candidatus Uhrbacteria bacterium]
MSLKHSRRATLAVFGIILLSLAFLFSFLNTIFDELRRRPALTFGLTFSPSYATSLGLDWRQIFISTLDDLQVRLLRLPAYWEDLEPVRGNYRFEDLDWMLEEAGQRGAKVLLAIGFKLPRWPECHAPAWAHELPLEERQAEILRLLRTLVTRYGQNQTIIAWQVENEPLLEFFGSCPEPDREFLKQEVALVRSLDHRPIVVTESGELSTWLRTVTVSDMLGISMYRVSWNPYLGYIYYPLSPGFYRRRAQAVQPLTKKILVTELQAEPWVPAGILNTTLEEQFQSMNAERLKDNISFVRRAGFSEVFLWGVEWWYWLALKQSDSSMWDLGRQIFSQSAPLRGY